jgi:hypothetical protein
MLTDYGFLSLGEIGKAFEFFKLGLTALTCDCLRGDWKDEVPNLSVYFPEAGKGHLHEFLFCKAFLLSYNEDKKSLYVALDAIEQYVAEKEEALGLNVKGKILTGLELYEEALECYQRSYNLDQAPRTLYRLGRLKEQYLNTYGVDSLYAAYMANPFSPCCCRVLKEYTIKHNLIQTTLTPTNSNILINGFLSAGSPWELQRDFEHLLKTEAIGDLYNETRTRTVIEEFGVFMAGNKHLYILLEEEYDYGDYDDYDDHYEEPDYDEMYFDAMTDGQLGSYDEFNESGGNLDWIDDWAGR